ncbi:erythromycin esterase family protein [Streptomyces olivoreticuli]|uniref:erythromycin esterase family protein n=1 Tax=Streptomyces olivoreticuli TaxID=68246 RepID=UPI000E2718BD|nr:erythromycin esterase family protein [Streptomyces olivoreticuli]
MTALPSHPAAHDPFADWLREHAIPLTGLDPDAPLDDLEPLRELLGTARVVAIGENSHFIEEFELARRRLLRFLAERCGFTVLAFEYGFSEGFALDAWAQGAGTDDDLARHLDAAIPMGIAGPLRQLRRHNRTAPRPVRFAGVDIPAAGGSLLPALEPLTGYLRDTDPDLLPLVEAATGIAGRFAATSGALAAPAWARLDTTEQDALTAALMRLLTRFRSLRPLYIDRSGQYAYDVALWRVEAACHADYTFRAMSDLFAGRGLPGDTSARDVYMAQSVLWHLEHSEPGTRMVLAAHNAHIQKTPVSFDGHLTGLPMGHHLQRALGEDYFALGVTSTAGHTAEMHLDEAARFGFTVENRPLDTPEPGSVEAAFDAAGTGLGVVGLRTAPRPPSGGPDRTRLQGAYLHTPVLDAFDGMLHVPSSTVAEDADL